MLNAEQFGMQGSCVRLGMCNSITDISYLLEALDALALTSKAPKP